MLLSPLPQLLDTPQCACYPVSERGLLPFARSTSPWVMRDFLNPGRSYRGESLGFLRLSQGLLGIHSTGKLPAAQRLEGLELGRALLEAVPVHAFYGALVRLQGVHHDPALFYSRVGRFQALIAHLV